MAEDVTLTPDQKEDMVVTLERVLELVRSLPAVTPCATCDLFAEGFCSEWNSEIPERMQPDGCPKWQRLPF